MNCPNCYAAVVPNAKFCGACGFRLSDAPATAASSSDNRSSDGDNDYSEGYQSVFDAEKTIVRGGSSSSSGNNNQQAGGYSNQSYTPPGGSSTYDNSTSAQSGIHIDADSRGRGRGYAYEILHQPSFALAVLKLESEQAIQAEAGAMVSMTANVELQSQLKGGVIGALKRAVGGESAFVSTFIARGGRGEVTLAPGGPGDIAALEMNNQSFLVQASSYLAGDIGLDINTKWGGARSFFGGEGLFVLRVQGTGLLLVSSFGAIHRKRLAAGERYVVDTGHLVAWEAHMPYVLRKAASGFFRSFVSGEGIVSEFTGPGEILIQTRNLEALAGLLRPFFPTQNDGGNITGLPFNIKI